MADKYIEYRLWLHNKILETPTSELRNLYADANIACNEFEEEYNKKDR